MNRSRKTIRQPGAFSEVRFHPDPVRIGFRLLSPSTVCGPPRLFRRLNSSYSASSRFSLTGRCHPSLLHAFGLRGRRTRFPHPTEHGHFSGPLKGKQPHQEPVQKVRTPQRVLNHALALDTNLKLGQPLARDPVARRQIIPPQKTPHGHALPL